MDPLENATLRDDERSALERFLSLVGERLGDDLIAVWLYGSRARGETPQDDSDVDVMVVTRTGRRHDLDRVHSMLWQAAEEAGANPVLFSVQVSDPGWLAERREIRSFFMQEVDRDKIVLAGDS